MFSRSSIVYLDDQGNLSPAGAFVLNLTGDEVGRANSSLRDLQVAVHAIQKRHVTPVETNGNDAETQVYRIDDFSDEVAPPVEMARAGLASTLGEDRMRALFAGIDENHSGLFCDFGKHVMTVSFKDDGYGNFVIEEETKTVDGADMNMRTYPTKSLPARYRDLFIIQ